MHVSVRTHTLVKSPKPVLRDIGFTPSSALKFAGQNVKLGGSVESLMGALRAKGVEVTASREPGHGYVNFIAKSNGQTLKFGGGGIEGQPGSIMGFDLTSGNEKRTVSRHSVSISSEVKLPKAYADVFRQGLTVDLGSQKPTIKLGSDIHQLARGLGVAQVHKTEVGNFGPMQFVASPGPSQFVRVQNNEFIGYEFSIAGTGKQYRQQLTVFADKQGKINQVWADAKNFKDGEVPFEHSVALTAGSKNESGKATLTIGESPSLIKDGIVKSVTTFTEGASAGVNRLSRSGL